jgi:hypothetical protein
MDQGGDHGAELIAQFLVGRALDESPAIGNADDERDLHTCHRQR